MNKKFQEYKKCKVVFTDDIPEEIELLISDFEITEEKQKYNRAKKKAQDRKEIDEGYVKWLEMEE